MRHVMRKIVYSVGSLFTSIVPCLVLPDIAAIIEKRNVPKVARSPSLIIQVLILNTCGDRESSGFTAVDFVRAIADAITHKREGAKIASCITHVRHHSSV